MTCKLTGSVGKGIKSHIIPESFYEYTSDGRNQTKLIPINSDGYLRRCPKGIYDDQMVTKEGEQYFNECDNYSSNFLLKIAKDAQITVKSEGKYFVEIENYNYNLLKLFCLSLLWRSHSSFNPFFSRVDVGNRHENILRAMILSKNPGRLNDYSVVFGFYQDTPDTGLGIINPWKTRRDQDNVAFYQFQLPHWIIHIKVDKRECPTLLQKLALEPNKSFYAFNQGYYSATNTYKKLVLPSLIKFNF